MISKTSCVPQGMIGGHDLNALSNMLSEGEKLEEERLAQDRVAKMGPVIATSHDLSTRLLNVGRIPALPASPAARWSCADG